MQSFHHLQGSVLGRKDLGHEENYGDESLVGRLRATCLCLIFQVFQVLADVWHLISKHFDESAAVIVQLRVFAWLLNSAGDGVGVGQGCSFIEFPQCCPTVEFRFNLELQVA